LDNPRSGAEITANVVALAIPPAAKIPPAHAVVQQTKPRSANHADQVNANDPEAFLITPLICQRAVYAWAFGAQRRTEKEHCDEHDDAEAA
jgi:hypothetical protein